MTRTVATTNSPATVHTGHRRGPARVYTDYLFPRPSFLSGVASILDLFGRWDSYNYSRTEKESDQRGLLTDYYMVGQDFWNALREFEAGRSHDELPQQDRLFDPDEVKPSS